MKNSDRGQRARRLGATLLLLLLPVLPLQARGKSEAWARTQYSAAEHLRENLNSLPSAQQSRREYQHVIAAYRRVYYGSPASSKADPSVVAVAELLTEMGRRFNDDKVLRSAIGQYKFLRREYPGSRDRVDALFTMGQIYQDDLKDPSQAKLVFEEFLHRYPHNHLASEARKALSEPVQQAGLRSKDEDDSDDDSSAPKRAEKPNSGKSLTSAAPEDGTSDTDANGQNRKVAHVTSIRHWSSPDYTRVAIGLERDIKFEAQRIDHPERIFFDLLDTNLTSELLGQTFDVDDGLLKKIRVAQFQPAKARIVLEVQDRSDYTAFLLTDPPRLIIDVHSKDLHSRSDHDPGNADKKTAAEKSLKEPAAATSKPSATAEAKLQVKENPRMPGSLTSAASSAGAKRTVVEADDDDSALTVAKLDPPEIKPQTRAATTLTRPTAAKGSSRGKPKAAVIFPDAREASPTANGDRSLIRALGLKIGKIVIDPGHGGHDTGTIGPNGLEEKDLVLDVGRRLGKLLQARLGADVVYTRKDDTFIPLETRTSIANQEQADLFVSIHANSSRDPDARGVETYYLNFTSSAEALDVAARENAASDKSIHELQDLVKKIALKEKIEESREFASNVQRALHSGLAAKSPGIRDRGVKKAPFIVLIGANMPSILAEISFVSNPGDERRLRTSDYRQRIAESLYRGISKYVSGLSGVKVASKIDKDESR
ncbi:MAG: N-acetylmuramoyl-L-alanine amidase [Acidobacteriia bacterium]|nr:N-acetylmuramoyl-L-alanine amidase [Terriglobia bacterium]